MRRAIVVGHRGAPTLAPENTIPSFKRAVELGVDFVELDVRATKDGALVVVHDETVDRTTNGSGRVAEMTLGEVKELDAGSWFSEEYAGVEVPTLDEVLSELGDSVGYVVELKVGGVEDGVVRLAREHSLVDRVVVHSSLWSSVARVRRLEPRLAAMVDVPEPSPSTPGEALAHLANLASVHVSKLEEWFVDLCRRRGLLVNAWPVNAAEEFERCVACGVAFVTTDRPQLIVELAERSARRA